MYKAVLPKAVRDLAVELSRLPGVGPKTARRLAIYFVRQPQHTVGSLAHILQHLHNSVHTCSRCYGLSDSEMCVICSDASRNTELLCVVEQPLDVEAVERTDSYTGLYHVLGGVLSPIEGVGPDQLTIRELASRVASENISELILALNPTLEAEATARHIMQHIDSSTLRITRLGRGLPTGGDIEYADAITLSAAFEGRKTL